MFVDEGGVNYLYFKHGHLAHNLSQKLLAIKAPMKLPEIFLGCIRVWYDISCFNYDLF